jgi:hypothetical protein
MEREAFKSLLEGWIAPMFPGCTVVDAPDAVHATQRRATQSNLQRIKVRWNNDTHFQFILVRSQRFTGDDADFVNNVVLNLNDLAPVEATPYFQEMIGAAIRRAVAYQVAPTFPDIVQAILREFEQWSEETYEGRPISAAIGVLPEAQNLDSIEFNTYLAGPYSKVAAGSMDALATFDSEGKFIGYEVLEPVPPLNEINSPQRFASIARWAGDHKVALVLSRNGEILVFRAGELSFARRRGAWRQFNHEALITQMRLVNTFRPAVARASYLTCLDVSFAKVGGGLALVALSREQALNDANRIHEDDRLQDGESDKVSFLKTAISNRTFNQLARPLRQTMLAMDGSTVLSKFGDIRTVGAIIKVEAGSKTGGGRKAAAMTFGEYGLGIKISSDGEIVGFSATGPDQEPLFRFG